MFLSPCDDFMHFGNFQTVTVRIRIQICPFQRYLLVGEYLQLLTAIFEFPISKILSIKRLPVTSHYFHLLNVFVSLRRFQRFWLFSNCHCKNTHIDMSIPKIPACRGISLASKCTFRISDFKNFVDKITSGSMPIFSIYFQRPFCFLIIRQHVKDRQCLNIM